jgi:hypothetical protein
LFCRGEKNEEKEDFNFADHPGLHSELLRLQLWGATGQIWAYWHTDADAHANSDSDSDSNTNSDSNSDSHANSHAHTNSTASTRPSGSYPYPATGNQRDSESRDPGRSGSLDDRTELDAHQSGAWNPVEYRQSFV